MSGTFTRAGGERPAHARGAGERPHGRARAATVRRRGALVRDDASARSSCPARTRRSTCCSCGRATSRSTSRTASSTSGSPAPTWSSRRRATSSRWPSSASHAARCRQRFPTTRHRRRSRTSTACASRPPIRCRPACCSMSGASRPISCRSPGSVEATPRLGLADAIVDLVSTGSTASANGLRLIGTLLASQAVLIGGRGAVVEQASLVERLELMLSGVVAARRRRYVMMNATVETLPAIRAVLPSMGAPTVLPLADEGESPFTPPSTPTTSGRCCPRCSEAGASSILVLPDRADRAVRGAGLDDAIAAVAPIVADVRDRGDAALLEWTERFDGPRPDGFRVPAAADRARPGRRDVLEALRAMIRAVRAFSEAQRPADTIGGGRTRDRLRAALDPARLRRRLRPERPGAAAVLARDDRRSGASGGRPAHRRRDAEPGRRDARRRARARARRDLRGRRRPGRRGARVRDRVDPARSTRSSARETRT